MILFWYDKWKGEGGWCDELNKWKIYDESNYKIYIIVEYINEKIYILFVILWIKIYMYIVFYL